MTKLTDEQAEAMLKQLSDHYKQPVMPVQRYCDALRQWSTALNMRAQDLKEELYPGISGHHSDPKTKAAYELYKAEKETRPEPPRSYQLSTLRGYESMALRADAVATDIRKSSMLYRLIYLQEPLRTVKCPEHKGEWSGIEYYFSEDDKRVCPHGCHMTGWLPAEGSTVQDVEP